MSFPRAKLHRFNEIANCTPSPADYNKPPQNPRSRTNSVASAGEKLSDNASVVSNDSSCFRTPKIIPKKKSTTQSSTKNPPTLPFNTTEKEILQSKIVECNNKDTCIKELTEQIEELKNQLANLNEQKSTLETEKSSYESKLTEIKEQHRKELDEQVSSRDAKLESIRENLKRQSKALSRLKKDGNFLKNEIVPMTENVIAEIKGLSDIFNNDTPNIFTETLSQTKENIILMQTEIDKLNEEILKAEEHHNKEIAMLNEKHDKEIEELQSKTTRALSETEKILEEERRKFEEIVLESESLKEAELIRMQEEFSQKILELEAEKEAELLRLEKEYARMRTDSKDHTEEQIKNIETDWNAKCEQLEKTETEELMNYQLESEAKVVEIELAKNKYKEDLVDLKQDLSELERSLSVQENYEKVEANLNDTVTKVIARCRVLEARKNALEAEVHDLQKHSQTYQITLKNTRATVHAISKRLLDSDNEVERLKREIDMCERENLDLENECHRYEHEIISLSEMTSNLEEQQHQTELVYQNQMADLKHDLELKTKYYMDLSADLKSRNHALLKEKQAKIDKVTAMMNSQSLINEQTKSTVREAEQKIANLEKINENIKDSLDKLKDEYNKKNETLGSLRDEKTKLSRQLTLKIEENENLRKQIEEQTTEVNIEDLHRQINTLQEKCETLQQYSEYYKCKVKEYEKEIEDSKKIEKNYCEQSQKTEELLKNTQIMEERKIQLENTLKEYAESVDPFRERLLAYEAERDALLAQKSSAERDVAALRSRYASLLAQDHHRQKVKQLMELREQNDELERANKKLEAKFRAQEKAVEKLRRELGRRCTPKKLMKAEDDKENVVESPLRDRN